MMHVFYFHLFASLIFAIDGAHFLGGTITWHPLNASATGTPVAIVITQTYLWTYSLMTCTNAMIAANQPVPSYASVSSSTLACITNCGSGSTGYSSLGVLPYCTDASSPIGTTVGQRSDTVYLQSGDNFSVAYQENAWRVLATASAAVWSISLHININPRSDNGQYNNAPVATMMSPINIPLNQSTVINVPVGDADGDPLRCRWSTNSSGIDECGGVCPPNSLPPNTVIYPNCTIIITGQHVGDWFAVTLMVEDFINSTSTVPLSSVPVQFLVQVVSPPSYSTPPKVIGLPAEQSCTSLVVGQQFSSQIIALNYNGPSVTLTDIATLSFSGMVKGSLTQVNSTVYYKNITWSPTASQLGYQVMCAMAFDSQNVQSAQYCFKLYVSQVGLCSCPGEPCLTTSTTTTSTSISTATTTTTTSTTSSVTSSTSTTSTTSTASSTTTTTSNSTTSEIGTTATTTTQIPDSINWPLIGSMIGLVVLIALALSCFVCCYFLCLHDTLAYGYETKGNIELYHIERCADPDCRWSDISNSSTWIKTSRRNPFFHTILNENIYGASTNYTIFQGKRFLPKQQTNISFGKAEHTMKNPGIKPPNRSWDEETSDSTVGRVRNTKVVKVLRIKPVMKSRMHGTGGYMQKNATVEPVYNPTRHRLRSARVVQVTGLHGQSSVPHPYSSNNTKNTHLDVINGAREPSRLFATHVSLTDREEQFIRRYPSSVNASIDEMMQKKTKYRKRIRNHIVPMAMVREWHETPLGNRKINT